MAATGRAHALATDQTTSLTNKKCKAHAMSSNKEENDKSTQSFFGRESVLATVRDRKSFFSKCYQGNIASWKWRLKGSGMSCFSRILALQRWFACKRNAKRLLNFYFLCLMQVSCHLVQQKRINQWTKNYWAIFT